MKIAVAGLGHVGLPLALLLSQRHQVMALDVDPVKVDLLNAGRSPLNSAEMATLLSHRSLNLRATGNLSEAFSAAEIVFVATPTDYDQENNFFDTTSVEQVVARACAECPRALVVIKSTVPVGFTKAMRIRHGTNNIIFSPEFLREGYELRDVQYPSRIVVGDLTSHGKMVADLLLELAVDKRTRVLLTESDESEAIKLFSNTYLAMRVAFFNELDTYAALSGLNSFNIIKGACLDGRIGDYYNNPSFGCGGYCLPKDIKQLLQNFQGVPQNMIEAVVQANATRKKFIIDQILRRKPETVGVYRLAMKSGSLSIRHSSTQDIMINLRDEGVNINIYEPALRVSLFHGCQVIDDLKLFKSQADIIIANRISNEIRDVMEKVFSCDLFGEDL